MMLLKVLVFALSSLTLRIAGQSIDCQAHVDHYLEIHHKESLPFSPDYLVYFLHVPRTAGRTFHNCFLKLGTSPERRCPKAYDHLRMDMNIPNCNLLSSHDDFSIVSMLHDNVTVVSQIRDPIDRFLSAYEFAVEVASRAVDRLAPVPKRGDRIATEDVWPWSYLVPFMIEDMRFRKARVNAEPQPDTGYWIVVPNDVPNEPEVYYHNKHRQISRWNVSEEEQHLILPDLDPYDNPLIMSLKDFAEHPITRELLHNGAGLQVLGITNYSHWGDAADVRRCLWEDEATQQRLLEVAEKRVRRFPHVGTTNRLFDSVSSAAASLNMPIDGPAWTGTEEDGRPRPEKEEPTPMNEGQQVAMLAKNVRTAREKLQEAQKALFKQMQSSPHNDENKEMRNRVLLARSELETAQEALTTARKNLPANIKEEVKEEEHEETAVEKQAPTQVVKRLSDNLGMEFQRCASRAQKRSFDRRGMSLANVVMPDGRYMRFSRELRKKIPQSTLDAIRKYSLIDLRLHSVAESMLNERRQQFEREGLFKELPQLPPENSRPAIRSKGPVFPKPEGIPEKLEL